MKISRSWVASGALAVLLLTGGLAYGDIPGAHPAFLHSLSDLRYARALIDRATESEVVASEEMYAIQEIDAAINEITRAAIDDGKNVADHPPVDRKIARTERFRKALELLAGARNDIRQRETDPQVFALRNAALLHIDEAFVAVALHNHGALR